ncbi:MAG: DoxX family protein [Candidatus Yanofskybacteria bacterium]|nr:DoxX family protein [Candidatus Yanofskybacteria bacterium]
MLENLSIYSDRGMWFLQFAVGVIFIVHGWPKIKSGAGMFKIGGLFHGLIEVVAGLALISNWYVREAGLVLAIIMLGAIYMKKFKWHTPFSSHNAMGWEYDFVLLAASVYFLVH